jgi:Protein of unknown function (DUF4058)
MKCPFPGMDPYLETPALWQGFHNRFITYLCDAISVHLPDNYDAQIEELLRVVEVPPPMRGEYRPDTSILRSENWSAARETAGGAVAILDPTAVVPLGEAAFEEILDVRIQVVRWPGSELVTAIELLSPWNKYGDGYAEFLRKRRAMLNNQVNLVEIDLLVGGERVPLGGPTPASDYRVVIARAANRPNADVYAWSVRDPLPNLPIPLRAPDSAIPISLGEVFASTYERGRLDKPLRRLSVKPALAPLSLADLAWASEVAQKR